MGSEDQLMPVKAFRSHLAGKQGKLTKEISSYTAASHPFS
jgi:hypothetical protein